MLPKARKISRADFPKQHENKRTWRGDVIFVRHYSNNASAHNTSFSVVISKKHAKNAVTRNTLKRRIYSAIHRALRDPKTFPNGKFIITPRAHLPELSVNKIYADLQHIRET